MTTPDAGQRLIEDGRVSELLAMHKLMEYADAWRTQPGCSCGQCQLCDARELSADDADAIAAILHESIKTIERLRGVEADARRYRRIRNGPYSDTHGDVYAMIFAGEGDYPLDGTSLDEAVDAAIKRSSK